MLATREKFWNNSNQKTTFLHSHKKKPKTKQKNALLSMSYTLTFQNFIPANPEIFISIYILYFYILK